MPTSLSRRLSVQDVIKRLAPLGTVDPGLIRAKAQPRVRWDICPPWPPDLFAIAGTLVNLSGCYARPSFKQERERDSYASSVMALARSWLELNDRKRDSLATPPELKDLWTQLAVKYRRQLVTDAHGDQAWWECALRLMAVADEACTGMGFLYPNRLSRFSLLYLEESLRLMRAGVRGPRSLHLPRSLCCAVPPTEVCVQPKARTAQVGSTLRSLSHNLALLPPSGEVQTLWHLGPPGGVRATEPLNLLLVPYPFKVDGRCFEAKVACPGRHGIGGSCGGANTFAVRQRWLEQPSSSVAEKRLRDTLLGLIRAAQREVREVDGVVLPELALSKRVASWLARELASESGLELFVSGVLVPGTRRDRLPRNAVYAAFFVDGKLGLSWLQGKHHRWKLDRSQICRYHLGDALDPDHCWWEKSDISTRTIFFREFRDGATLATLVCEDLARVDPVQPAVRAVGPNLVVALLMDGPQLKDRWAARYATVLAEDPGCSVLTLTSWGMVQRSWMTGEGEKRQIALWKEPAQDVRELSLPPGSQALLLSLCVTHEENFTLDGRSDHGASYRVSMAGAQPVRFDGAHSLTP